MTKINQIKDTVIPLEIEHIFDAQTKQLYYEVSKCFNISFEAWEKDFWEVATRDHESVVYYTKNDLNTTSLAHELLHLWLKQFDFFSINHLHRLNLGHDFWGEVWNKNLCDHVGNCMVHHKMYPKYIEMGYAPDLFILDANIPQATIQGIKPIYLKRNGRISARDIELFIADLIAINTCAYGHDYTKQLNLLKDKDSELFEIVSKFWKTWNSFELSHENNDIQELYNEFMEQLEFWYETKSNKTK